MPRTSAITVVLGVLCLGTLGIATNVASGVLPSSWHPYLWLAWPLVALLLVATAVLELRRRAADPGAGSENPRARAALLDRVHRYWVRGVLEQALHQQVHLDLELTVTVDARHPWNVAGEQAGAARPVPPGTSIAEVFDELDQLMLVLGEPGSGKTTALLELASELLRRAETDQSHPIPVVLMLSSWSGEQLDDWIVHELSSRYGIPARQARFWLDTDELTPLLDGLDEVAKSQQRACVAAINAFRGERGATRIVVCCRAGIYQGLEEHLLVYGTLIIRPLTDQQIAAFIAGAGPGAAAIRAALAVDSSLTELVRSPLMLSIAVLAYRDAEPGIVTTVRDREQLRDRLFTTYVRTVLGRRRSDRRGIQHAPRDTVRRLAWLASVAMPKRPTMFALENLTKYTTTSRHWSANPAGWICMLVTAPALGIAGWLGYGWRGGLAGLTLGALAGLPFRFFVNTVDLGFTFGGGDPRGHGRVPPGRSFRYYSRFCYGIGDTALLDYPEVVGAAVIGGGATGVLLGGGAPGAGIIYGAATAIAMVIAASCCIEAAEPRHWEFVTRSPSHREVPSPMALAVLRRGLRVAPVLGLVAAIVPGLMVGWGVSGPAGLRFGVFVAVGVMLYAVTALGGYALVEQVMVRRELARRGVAPLPLRPFLDYAVDCSLLRQVGDSYLFVHLSLREYFAAMWQGHDVPDALLHACDPDR